MKQAVHLHRERLTPSYLAFALLSIVTWSLLNVMIAFGIVATAFILMGNAHWQSVFVELANLAQHYLAAPDGARADFRQLVTLIVGATAAFVAIVRIKPLVDTLAAGLETRS